MTIRRRSCTTLPFIAIGPGGGGIEHLNSTSISFSGDQLNMRAGKNRMYNFLAHEYFQHYNVKRIRPSIWGRMMTASKTAPACCGFRKVGRRSLQNHFVVQQRSGFLYDGFYPVPQFRLVSGFYPGPVILPFQVSSFN
ncbi:hypothetical protein [Larkinella rosea]|uniref:hypothetical protein n=1 Tax=Larkinella rosea TaxID=2025312 RepID=UPI00163B19B0|nr:hypothetical protein [Larkinella rosea]